MRSSWVIRPLHSLIVETHMSHTSSQLMILSYCKMIGGNRNSTCRTSMRHRPIRQAIDAACLSSGISRARITSLQARLFYRFKLRFQSGRRNIHHLTLLLKQIAADLNPTFALKVHLGRSMDMRPRWQVMCPVYPLCHNMQDRYSRHHTVRENTMLAQRIIAT